MGNQLTPEQRQWVEDIRNEPRPVLATYYRHTIDCFLRIIDEHFPPPAPEQLNWEWCPPCQKMRQLIRVNNLWVCPNCRRSFPPPKKGEKPDVSGA